MKVRNGFVSNSSSSSFIVAVKNDTGSAKITITTEVDLSDHARETCKTTKDLDAHFLNEWAYGFDTIKKWIDESEDESWAIDQYLAAKKAIKNGKIIIIGSFCNDSGDAVESMLCDSGLKGIVGDDIEIIHSEGGF